jgi:hypothetical protein
LRVRSTVVHEVHHLVAEALYPKMGVRWPTWLSEGLAETAAREAMGEPEASAFHAQHLGYWTHARLRGTAPHREDLLGDSVGEDVPSYYAAAYLLVSRLAREPEKLHAILAASAAEPRNSRAKDVARAEMERRFGDAPYREVLDLPETEHPAVLYGHLDAGGGRLRIVSEPEAQARVIFPGRVEGPVVEFHTTFSWGPVGQHQADAYVAYSEGQRAAQFLKVAVMPDSAMLFWFRRGEWTTVGRVAYDTKLEVGEDVRHPLRIRYDADAGKLRLETTGGRWAEFLCPDHVPVAGTRIGLGCYDGVVLFEPPEVD